MCIQLGYPRKQKLKIWKALCCLETHFTLNPKIMIRRPRATLRIHVRISVVKCMVTQNNENKESDQNASFVFRDFRVRISTERHANLTRILRCFNQSIQENKC
jgi:hypothetical protein